MKLKQRVDGVTEAVEGMLDSSQQKQSVPKAQEPVLYDSGLMLKLDSWMLLWQHKGTFINKRAIALSLQLSQVHN